MREEIKTSNQNSKYRIIVIFVLGLILLIFTSQLLRTLNDLLMFDITRLANLIRFFILLATFYGAFVSWQQDNKNKYFITDDSIIIQKNSLGKQSEDIYNSRNITSISVKQSTFGVKNNYGTLIINSDKLYNNQSIYLKNIVDPKKVASKVNNFLVHK